MELILFQENLLKKQKNLIFKILIKNNNKIIKENKDLIQMKFFNRRNLISKTKIIFSIEI